MGGLFRCAELDCATVAYCFLVNRMFLGTDICDSVVVLANRLLDRDTAMFNSIVWCGADGPDADLLGSGLITSMPVSLLEEKRNMSSN
jgi:hypothetical protein